MRRALVVVQVSIAFVLLMGSGLLLTSLRNLLTADPGFDTTNLVTAHFDLPVAKYRERGFASAARVTEAALARIRELPGVTGAGGTQLMPFSQIESTGRIWPEDAPTQPDMENSPAWNYQVSTGYLEAMGIPILRGRAFEENDNTAFTPDSAEGYVMIVDETLAARLWPNRDALGQRAFFGQSATQTPLRYYTIVGIAGSIRHNDLAGSASDQRGAFYTLHTQVPAFPTYALAIRSAEDPVSLTGPIRDILNRLDPAAPIYRIATMSQRTELSLASRKLASTLALTFGITAVLLAAVGLYGLLAYLVSQRRREFGIRIALGSTAAGLLRLVFREGLGMLCAGLVLGLAGAFVLRDFLAQQIFGVEALDPRILVAVATVLVAISGTACLLPSIRATRMDPVRVLGDE